MKTMLHGLALALVGMTFGASAFTACSSSDQASTNAPQGTHTLKSNLARDTDPDVSDADARALSDGNSAFALDFYRAIKGDNGNMMFSPWSMSIALAMTWAGARGNTADEMASALHFTLPQERLHPAFNRVDLALQERNEASDPESGKGFSLDVVNALWAQDGYPFEQSYLDTIAVNYGAGLFLVDFANSEVVRGNINSWVSDQTHARIPELIPTGVLSGYTRMVLTNAVYFKAPWASDFWEGATADGPFHTLSGGDVTVPLMVQTDDLRYAEGEGFQIAEMPYEGGAVAMTFVLPQEGQFGAIEDGATWDWLSSKLATASTQKVTITLPKFKFRTTIPAKSYLQSLGMIDAFTDACDLNGMAATNELLITDVLHQSFIAVDEKGTEAAAATAVVVGMDAGIDPNPPQPKEFRMDRPFMFFIRDLPTQTILFAGRVIDPTAE